MSKPYKALQSKALHKGMYLAYVVAKDHQYTTNGQIMVAKVVTPEEVKPLKDQLDKRVGGESMADVTFIIDALNSEDTPVASAQVGREWVSSAGLDLIEARGIHRDGESVVNVQSVYVDYVNAAFEVKRWYMTKHALFATNDKDEIIAVVARVKEQYSEEEKNSEA